MNNTNLEVLKGWLSPDGEFIDCSFIEHLQSAYEIVTNVFPNKYKILRIDRPVCEEDYLLEMGYIKIGDLGVFFPMDSDFVPLDITPLQSEWMCLNVEKFTHLQLGNISDGIVKIEEAKEIEKGVMKEYIENRLVDDLGRVCIPKRIRKWLGIDECDSLEIYLNNKEIILKKQELKEDKE